VTVGPYSPLPIGNSRRVPKVLARHLQSSPVIGSLRQLPIGPVNYLQGPPVTHRPRPSPVLLASHLTRSYRANCATRHLQSPSVPPGQSSARTPRYPSIPGTLSGTVARSLLTRRRMDSTLVFTGYFLSNYRVELCFGWHFSLAHFRPT